MKSLVCGIGAIFLYVLLASILISETIGEPTETCQPRNTSYRIADTEQCDKYHECTKAGKLLERLCEDGLVFKPETSYCDYPHNVDCSTKPILQPPQSTNPECERMNGFYAFPASDSCQKFHHCLEGKAYEKTCPEGVIFDISKGTCVHPDLAKRPECAARTVLNFTCPNHGKKFVRLRFGDHDRLPHPTNCRKFFICLHDGKPRVGGCPLGKVFNGKLGMCDSPKRVLECKDYYGKKNLTKLEKLAELGEEGALEEDLLDQVENVEDPFAEDGAVDTDDNSVHQSFFIPFQQQQEPHPEEQQQTPEITSAPGSQKSKSKGKKFQSQSQQQQL